MPVGTGVYETMKLHTNLPWSSIILRNTLYHTLLPRSSIILIKYCCYFHHSLLIIIIYHYTIWWYYYYYLLVRCYRICFFNSYYLSVQCHRTKKNKKLNYVAHRWSSRCWASASTGLTPPPLQTIADTPEETNDDGKMKQVQKYKRFHPAALCRASRGGGWLSGYLRLICCKSFVFYWFVVRALYSTDLL